MYRVVFMLVLLLSAAQAEKPHDHVRQQLEKIASLADARKFDDAQRLLDELHSRFPSDPQILVISELIRQKRTTAMIAEADIAAAEGQVANAQRLYAAAYALDPQNEYARQRFSDTSKKPVRKVTVLQLDSEPELKPAPGLHDLEYRGDSRGLVSAFAKEFGLTAEFEPNFVTRPVRFTLRQANFDTALRAVTNITKSFIVPLDSRQFLLAGDDPESRRRLERMSLRTFFVPDAASPQDLIEIVNVLRMMFDLRQIMPNQSTSSVTVRAPGPSLDAAQRLLEDLSKGRPEVLIDVQVIQLSHTQNVTTGVALPLQFTAFNVNTELRKLVSDPNTQALINQLVAGGQLTPQQAAALAALIASAQNSGSPLLQGFATFGGGLTRTGVVIPPASVTAQLNSSDVKIYQRISMRAQHGKAATYRIGDRYPVLTGTFSPLVNIPLPPGLVQQNNAQPLTPSFNYEDLGITFKATPSVSPSGEIRVDFDLALRALAGQQFNGVPAISNRQYVGSLNMKEGDVSVIAGSVNETEQRTIRGLPFLSQIPGLREAFSTTSRDKTDDQLLLLVTAHRVRSGHDETSPEIVLQPSGSSQ
jgi:type II secretory pathway component GspD/PulD (secretin)